MTSSTLDDVPGLGPVRRTRLLKEIGGMRALRTATPEQLAELDWLPEAVGLALYRHLHGAGPSSAVTPSRAAMGETEST